MDSVIDRKKKREKEILELLREGKTQTKIAKIMGVLPATIGKWIREIDPQKVEEAKKEGKIKRKQSNEELENERQILELIREGKTQIEIARILKRSASVICTRIREIDPKKVEEAKREGKIKRKQSNGELENERQMLELLREGKTQAKIAEIKEVSEATISKWIREIDPKAVKDAKKQGKERIQKLHQKGKKVEEIAEIVGISQLVIIRMINKMNANEEEQEEINEVMEGSSSTISAKVRQVKAKPNYSQLKQKLKDYTITRYEIDDYRDYLDDKYNKIELKEIILMANMYIKTKRTSEAIKFINLLIGNEDMEYLGKEKLIEARNEIERIRKHQRARELVESNKSISEIMVATGLKEIEVIRIRNQMQGDRDI